MESPLPGVHFFRCSSICFQLLYSRGIHVCILQGEGLRGMKDLAALPSFDETSHPFSRHTFANPRPKTKNIQHFIIIHKKNAPENNQWQWKIHHLNMHFLLKMGIFQCHLSFSGVLPNSSSKKKRPETPEPTWRPLVPCSRLSVPHRDTPKPLLANLGHTCQVGLVRWDEGRFIPVNYSSSPIL